MLTNKLGYQHVDNTTTTIKSGPAGLFAIIVVADASVAVYDNTAGSGTVLFTDATMTAGQVIHFGGHGIAANNGLTAVVGTGTANFLYT